MFAEKDVDLNIAIKKLWDVGGGANLTTLFFGKILTLLRQAEKSLPVPVKRFNPQSDIQPAVQQSGRGLNPCLIAKVV
ncbi:hypothetical protein QUB63_10690 [Microcoleus sp. ARI1-B5]|uniref:hypothetical protein n=1 Tax=unclassified Microcoleus TaxID=2642155 RepID=UPI002FCFF543